MQVETVGKCIIKKLFFQINFDKNMRINQRD